MDYFYPNLSKPLTVANTTFRNRLFTAPITLHSLQAGEPYPTEPVITHFANKARGGAACVTCCGVNVFPYNPSDLRVSWDVYQKPYVHYLAQLAQRIHFYGAKASMEIGAVGVARAEWAVSDGARLISGAPGKEMPESEMERYADCFAHAAEALKTADFDMILLHFGHGLTMGQFLSPLTNRRTDQYGGSLENRARFPIMVIDRIRQKVGRDILIEVRVSGSERVPGGIEVDETIEWIRMVENKIDLIHVSAGLHGPEGMTVVHPTGFLPSTPNVYLAEAVKKAGVKLPVVTIGGIQDLDGAEAIIADGRADVVAIARGFIADPDLGRKAYDGRGADVTPCIKCMRCHDSAVWEYRYVCSVNPEIGLEHQLSQLVRPPEKIRKIVVAGGGPAGMKAALIAADRGHEVVLLERSHRLGGMLNTATKVSFKYDLKRYMEYLIHQVSKATICVKLNTPATPEVLTQLNPDIVVAAIGAEPIMPPIQGVDGSNALTAIDVYEDEERLGERVAVIGGGHVGCEIALYMGSMGKHVTVLEMRDELAPDATATQRTELLLKLEADEKVTCITSARCTGVTETGVCYADAAGEEQEVFAENTVIAAGMHSRHREVAALADGEWELVCIGDCDRPATVEQATYSAFCAMVRI